MFDDSHVVATKHKKTQHSTQREMKRWGDETSRAASSVEYRAAGRVQSSEAHDMQKQNPKTLKRAFLTFRHVCCGTVWVCVVAGVRHVCVSKLNFTGKNLLYWFKEARDGGGIRVNYGRQSELWVAANRVSAVDAALTHTVRLSLSSLSVYLSHTYRPYYFHYLRKYLPKMAVASCQLAVWSCLLRCQLNTFGQVFKPFREAPKWKLLCVDNAHTRTRTHTAHTCEQLVHIS